MTSTSRPPFPDGTWRVDPGRSEIGFAVKGLWGLVTVRGVFGSYEGRLTAGAGSASGELTIDAASVNTQHGKRDRHLRSPDFFDVERHPRIVFSANALTARDDGGLTVIGELAIGATRLPLEIPVTVERLPDGSQVLGGETTVTREAAGLTWNMMRTIGDVAVLHARMTLERMSPLSARGSS